MAFTGRGVFCLLPRLADFAPTARGLHSASPLWATRPRTRHTRAQKKAAVARKAEENDKILEGGVKSTLIGLLRPTKEEGRTVEELWELAEPKGLRSKRFMKMMLNQLRRSKLGVLAAPGKPNYRFYYSPEQQQGKLRPRPAKAAEEAK